MRVQGVPVLAGLVRFCRFCRFLGCIVTFMWSGFTIGEATVKITIYDTRPTVLLLSRSTHDWRLCVTESRVKKKISKSYLLITWKILTSAMHFTNGCNINEEATDQESDLPTGIPRGIKCQIIISSDDDLESSVKGSKPKKSRSQQRVCNIFQSFTLINLNFRWCSNRWEQNVPWCKC